MLEKIETTVKFIQNIVNIKPTIGIIMGSGLGNLANDISISHQIDYKDIPNFPISTVTGHKGNLIFGTIGENHVIAMQGRFHYYEGYDMETVTFPVRIMKAMGVETLIVSNASGGVNPNYKVSDLVIITDHINFFPEHPLRGENIDTLGPRFLNMHQCYDISLITLAKKIANEQNIKVKEGVYLGLQGPTFETLAEYKMVKAMGADFVGMSTVPEVIVARHGGMKCFGISIITDMGEANTMEAVSHEEVLQAAKNAEPNVRKLIYNLVKNI
jgi:purine-nucleoside phosphorylase